MGVKYVLSLSDITSDKLTKFFRRAKQGCMKIKMPYPVYFFVDQIRVVKNKNEAIKEMFRSDFNPLNTAVIEKSRGVNTNPPQGWTNGEAGILEYSANRIVIKTENKGEGFLVLTDSYYPTWHASIDGLDTKIYTTDFNFRGIVIPKENI